MVTETRTPGWTIREVELLLGLSPKYAYKLIRRGRLRAYVACDGSLRVSPYELHHYIRQREAKSMG